MADWCLNGGLIGSVTSILGKNDMQNRLDSALQDVGDKFMMLEETEKNAVRTALIEERSRFCLFISCLKPVVVRRKFSISMHSDSLPSLT